MIRSFEFKDIPTIHRYRQRGLFLDSIPTFIWGRTLVPAGAVLSPISAAMGVFTSIHIDEENQENPVVGQVIHQAGSPFARFTFIAPDSAVQSPILSPLIEHLIKRVGARGAESLTAEIDEKSQTFQALRRAQFSIYSRQRIWQINDLPLIPDGRSVWHNASIQDEYLVRRLYQSIVPGLVQQVEPAPKGRIKGYVYYKDGELLAYISTTQGPRGVWVQPFIHPEMENLDWHLLHLLNHLQPRPTRPVYFCLRSYQSWLSISVEDLGANSGPSQAVMVRRLTAAVKKPELAPLPVIDKGTEPTPSFFKSKSKSNKPKRFFH